MSRLRLLQICNVGEIVGGTAACAWTVTRALPEFGHVVAFLSNVSDETRRTFQDARVERWSACSRRAVDALRPDVVIAHNVGGRGLISGSAVTVQYVHSVGRRAPADVTVYCSRWLAAQMGGTAGDVLYQGVPRPVRTSRAVDRRGNRDGLVIGRICTPIAQKWPASIIPFYARLAERFPDVNWEFVGCPRRRWPELETACRGRARFFRASWHARRRLWKWDALLYHNPDVTESFGRTVAESLRAGCVPIVDVRGGFVEQVTPATGVLCASLEDFVAGIARLQDYGVRRRMSAAAQADGERQFSIGAFRERLLGRIRLAAAKTG